MLILGTGYSTDLLLIFSFLLLLLLIFYLISYKFLRKILFLFDPELIHKISFRFLKIIFLLPNYFSFWEYFFRTENNKLKKKVFGITFDNPVGLAAGFDKDAEIFDGLSSFGFGFVEIGTVTPLPQDGNPKPRLFRLPKDNAVINRMGFNNDGVEAVTSRLRRKKSKIIVGSSIGKNFDTPNNRAHQDYIYCLEKVYEFSDYIAVNISSPNTANLRKLSSEDNFDTLLKKLKESHSKLSTSFGYKPIFIKISPDETQENLILIYPCSDPGFDYIINKIRELSAKYKNIKVFKNIEGSFFYEIMQHANLLIGNSSSGILESGYLNLPTINVGNRQKGRFCEKNVFHLKYNFKLLNKGIKKALSKNNEKKFNTSFLYYNKGGLNKILKFIKNVNKKNYNQILNLHS